MVVEAQFGGHDRAAHVGPTGGLALAAAVRARLDLVDLDDRVHPPGHRDVGGGIGDDDLAAAVQRVDRRRDLGAQAAMRTSAPVKMVSGTGPQVPTSGQTPVAMEDHADHQALLGQGAGGEGLDRGMGAPDVGGEK